MILPSLRQRQSERGRFRERRCTIRWLFVYCGLAAFFQPAIRPNAAFELSYKLQITREVLKKWVVADRQSAQTHGEPGFMDIFLYLQELGQNLAAKALSPDLVILSGRTSRFAFIKEFTAQYLSMPMHKVRTLGDLIPDEMKGPDHDNMDKLAVVHGAHRFRMGSPVEFRFVDPPEKGVFQRFVGILSESPAGLRQSKVLVQPGDTQPRTCKLKLMPHNMIRIGNSFRKDGMGETLGILANDSEEERTVEIDLLDDYQIQLKKSKDTEGVFLTEWVPGGTSEIVDNFNDTGRIDAEPEGFIRRIILSNRDEWMTT